jgi:hypothetical protein
VRLTWVHTMAVHCNTGGSMLSATSADEAQGLTIGFARRRARLYDDASSTDGWTTHKLRVLVHDQREHDQEERGDGEWRQQRIERTTDGQADCSRSEASGGNVVSYNFARPVVLTSGVFLSSSLDALMACTR